MVWILKNTVTNEDMLNRKETFQDLCHLLDEEIDHFVKTILTKGNRSTIKRGIKKLKKNNEILVFHNYDLCGGNDPNVWQYMKPKLIEHYLNSKFDFNTTWAYKRLLARFTGSFTDKFIVKPNPEIDLSQLGLIYINAKIFDSNIGEELIILTQDQLNYLKLAYPENTMYHSIEVNKVLKELTDIGLLE